MLEDGVLTIALQLVLLLGWFEGVRGTLVVRFIGEGRWLALLICFLLRGQFRSKSSEGFVARLLREKGE